MPHPLDLLQDNVPWVSGVALFPPGFPTLAYKQCLSQFKNKPIAPTPSALGSLSSFFHSQLSLKKEWTIPHAPFPVLTVMWHLLPLKPLPKSLTAHLGGIHMCPDITCSSPLGPLGHSLLPCNLLKFKLTSFCRKWLWSGV